MTSVYVKHYYCAKGPHWIRHDEVTEDKAGRLICLVHRRLVRTKVQPAQRNAHLRQKMRIRLEQKL